MLDKVICLESFFCGWILPRIIQWRELFLESLKNYFYKNTDSDEVLFIHKGSGKLRTLLGNIDFKYGDYLVIPRGIIYQIEFNDADNRLFIVESKSPVYTPKRYRNWFGQHVEGAPYCERDLHPPTELETFNETEKFRQYQSFQ